MIVHRLLFSIICIELFSFLLFIARITLWFHPLYPLPSSLSPLMYGHNLSIFKKTISFKTDVRNQFIENNKVMRHIIQRETEQAKL